MADKEQIKDQALGRLLPFGPVAARRMFGGFGLFLDDVMFGLIADEGVFFKVDDGNRAEYEAAGQGPYSFQGKRRRISMSYYKVPPGVYDDPGELAEWAGRAFDAARRTKQEGGGWGRRKRRGE